MLFQQLIILSYKIIYLMKFFNFVWFNDRFSDNNICFKTAVLQKSLFRSKIIFICFLNTPVKDYATESPKTI